MMLSQILSAEARERRKFIPEFLDSLYLDLLSGFV